MSWWSDALCRGWDQEALFPTNYRSEEAKHIQQICRRCPVRVNCLQDAMDLEAGKYETSRHGLWGGLTPQDRARLGRRSAKSEASDMVTEFRVGESAA